MKILPFFVVLARVEHTEPFGYLSGLVAVFGISWSGLQGSSSLVLSIIKMNRISFSSSCSTQCFPSVYCNLLIPALCEGSFKRG